MRFKFLTTAVVAIALLGGCVTNPETQPKQTLGTMLGAGIGGLAGAQMGRGKGRLVAVAMGALAGAAIGNSIGQSLDRADRAQIYSAQQVAHNAPMGRSVTWNNSDSGHHGTVTPTRDGYDRISGDYCREYENTIFVDGREETGYGTACQKADGTWEITS
ncbi:MAG: RT0821/Lpp0805 family surface protein [Rhodospirillaceae bacterium]